MASEKLTIREAINKATRQQTLTQRIAKVYLAINNNLYDPKLYQERDAAIELFQSQLDELKLYAPTDKTKASLKHVQLLWKDYKAVANWSINEEGAVKVLQLCDAILFASDLLSMAYQEYAQELNEGTFNHIETLNIIKLIETTGTQRMLTQRMMLFYLAAKQNIDLANSQQKLALEVEKYKNTLKQLENADLHSQDIRTELKVIQQDWTKLNTLLNNLDNDIDQVNEMMSLADNICKEADKISVLYEVLGVKLTISKAINVSSYQNMLTQRIAKAYVALAYGYAPAKYKREITESIDLFEEHMLSMIRSSGATEDFKATVGVVKTMWKNYKKLVTSWDKIDEISVIKVLEKGHVMMATCDRVAQEIEVLAKTIPEYKAFFVKENGEATNTQENIAHQMHLAGLQRVYSQRIAIYYVMNALEIDAHLSLQRMKSTIASYNKNMQDMLTSSVNSPQINAELKKVKTLWDVIEKRCDTPTKDDITPIMDLCANLFTELDQLNNTYEQEIDNLFMQQK
ncbi:MAG: Unknown protein [uncultured Aureispira sp.]|uniref:NarX-like N-terminal domain-containing protein n=1 Tax=uncultured Aureispira sp. TaxID=1331704 RepID=A0A6S6SB07_9BACT|nr:MAG: Unknown protein [uncultured Aureispira sp.]